MTYTSEDIEQAVAHVDFENRGVARMIVRNLFKHAQPGNWAWRSLENNWGFRSNYMEEDNETHWSDNK